MARTSTLVMAVTRNKCGANGEVFAPGQLYESPTRAFALKKLQGRGTVRIVEDANNRFDGMDYYTLLGMAQCYANVTEADDLDEPELIEIIEDGLIDSPMLQGVNEENARTMRRAKRTGQSFVSVAYQPKPSRKQSDTKASA